MIGLPKYNAWRICIVCEGYEEEDYIKKLDSKKVFSDKYELIPINAKGIGNVFSVYQDKYQLNSYHLVLIFCDTDKVSKSEYLELKEKINNYYDRNDITDDLIIFGSPTTMQIILSHFGKVNLKSQSKHTNQPIIEKLTGIKKYDATDEQRKELFNKINRKNYLSMKENLKEIPTDDLNKPATNILKFLNKMENDETEWIVEINNKLTEKN